MSRTLVQALLLLGIFSLAVPFVIADGNTMACSTTTTSPPQPSGQASGSTFIPSDTTTTTTSVTPWSVPEFHTESTTSTTISTTSATNANDTSFGGAVPPITGFSVLPTSVPFIGILILAGFLAGYWKRLHIQRLVRKIGSFFHSSSIYG